MKNKFSLLKLNVLILLIIWCGAGIIGVLYSFSIEKGLFYITAVPSIGLSSYFLWRKYKPIINKAAILDGFILLGSMPVYETGIIEVFEINTLEKIIFSIKSPESDYSACFLHTGLILKTSYGSFLVDDTEASFIDSKKSRRIKNPGFLLVIFYMLLIIPAAGVFLSSFLKIDPIVFSAFMFISIYIVVLRFLPPFYLGKRIQINKLPLSKEEAEKFKGITIIKGFALSDRLSVIPLKKPVLLEGLAIDMLFKKYIILNSRLFYLGSEDYLRFVLFHELCHIKHRDSSKVFSFAILLMLIDMAVSLLPLKVFLFIMEYFPFYEYLLMSAAFLYIVFTIKRRKFIEKRADTWGIKAIGDDGVSRVYEKTGINLRI